MRARRSRGSRVGTVLLLLLAVAVAAVGFLAVASGVHLTRLVGWDEAERLMAALAIEEGMTVADVGAGDGWLAVQVASRVGPDGQVFATEIDEKQLAAIRERARREGRGNVSVVAAGTRNTGLPAACCEVIYLRHVYHHVTEPAALNDSLFASVAPGGRLAIIDFEPRGVWRWFGDHGTGRDGHGVHRHEVIQELEAAGFQVERREDRWGRVGYLLVFRRPEAARAGVPPDPAGSAAGWPVRLTAAAKATAVGGASAKAESGEEES